MPKRKATDPAARQRREAAKAQKRAEAEARAAEVARLEDARREHNAERIAPAAVRNAVLGARDPNRVAALMAAGPVPLADLEATRPVLRGPLVEVAGSHGARSAAGQVAAVLGQRGDLPADSRHHDVIGELTDKSRMITSGHLSAARKLQADWAEVGAGIGVASKPYGDARGGGDGFGLDMGILMQVEARRRLDGALTWLGGLCDIVVPVVLDCIPVAAWARQRQPEPWDARHAIGYLAAALSRLEAFYEPPKAVRAQFNGGTTRILFLVSQDVADRTPALAEEGA